MKIIHLPETTLALIDSYRNFSVGSATCNIPYYNNRTLRGRAKLRAQAGKGNPRDIVDELETVASEERINLKNIDSASLKKILVDKNIGIDCSGLVYHVLSPRHFKFPYATGLLGKLRAKFRPAENASAESFAHDTNSRAITLLEVHPGDIITMIGSVDQERDHILLIHQVEYEGEVPVKLSYTHTVAWPTDGPYGHGVRQGVIEIIDITKPLTDQMWQEAGKTGPENYTFSRALKSTTTLRRPLFL